MRLHRRIAQIENAAQDGCDHCRSWRVPVCTWERVDEGETPTGPAADTARCPKCGREAEHVHILWEYVDMGGIHR